jgi:hypothetical protein
MWGFPRRAIVVGIFAGARTWDRDSAVQGRDSAVAGQAGACARGAAKDVGTRSSTVVLSCQLSGFQGEVPVASW